MWMQCGSVALAFVMMLLGADSFANGLAGLSVRRDGAAHRSAWFAAIAAAVVPMAAVAATALWFGQGELLLGGLVGTAIAELGLVLGLAACMAPLKARMPSLAWLHGLVLIAIVLFGALGIDARYSRMDGGILLGASVLVVVLVARAMRGERAAVRALFEQPMRQFGLPMLVLRLLVGVALLGFGSRWLVQAGAALATGLDVTPLLIGLLVIGPATALAGGLSALTAGRRGQGEFALAHVQVASLACLLLLPGLILLRTTLTSGASLSQIELPALLAMAVAIYPMMRSDGELSRREGGVLLAAFALFVCIELWLALA